MPPDYYRVLGILPTATDDVVRAVYRALAKKHHPDTGGDAERFREISEAYTVLTDPVKRREFDRSHDIYFSPETDIGETDEELEREWSEAIHHAPEIDFLYWELKRYSNSLSLNFRTKLLNDKSYEDASILFNRLERLYFTTYFGTSPVIHRFVKFLLIEGLRDAAKDLNKSVKMFGQSLNPEEVIAEICRKYNLIYYKMNENTHNEERF
jgi:curved DNA-binding protein CbpA